MSTKKASYEIKANSQRKVHMELLMFSCILNFCKTLQNGKMSHTSKHSVFNH